MALSSNLVVKEVVSAIALVGGGAVRAVVVARDVGLDSDTGELAAVDIGEDFAGEPNVSNVVASNLAMVVGNASDLSIKGSVVVLEVYLVAGIGVVV